MTRRRLVWIAVPALVLVAAGFWATTKPDGEFRGLDARLAEAAHDVGHDGRINLADVTDFEWDGVYIFGAYTSTDEIAAQMDGWTPLSPLEQLVFGDLFLAYDGRQLLAFSRNDEVIAWTVMNLDESEVERSYIEFDPVILPLGVNSEDAAFVVESRLGGWSLKPG